jgi:hypothetical protein
VSLQAGLAEDTAPTISNTKITQKIELLCFMVCLLLLLSPLAIFSFAHASKDCYNTKYHEEEIPTKIFDFAMAYY